MKTKSYLTLADILIACVCGGCAFQSDGPQHVYFIQPAPSSLTDELAIAKAGETLAQEIGNTNDWQFTPPVVHQFKNSVAVGFKNTKDGSRRTYEVQLQTNRVVCYYHHGI